MNRIGTFAAALLVTCCTASAQEPVSFQGKQILMVIGYAAGGGTDAAGRLIAGHLGKYLPGQPTIVVQNVPGADGMVALNYIVQQTKPDGLTITMGSGTQIDPLHSRKPQAKYDIAKFNFIGGAGKGGTVLLINKDAEKRIFDNEGRAGDHGRAQRDAAFRHADDRLGQGISRLERQMGASAIAAPTT